MTQTGRADALITELTTILTDTHRNGRHGTIVSDLLATTIDTAHALSEKLTTLQTYIVLEQHDPAEDEMTQARHVWESIPESTAHHEVSSLVATSPTLHTLNRAAVEVRSVFRYSPEQLRLARVLGTLAEKRPHYVGMLVPPPEGKPRTFRIDNGSVAEMAAVLAALEKSGATTGYALQAQFGKDGSLFWKPQGTFPKHWTPKAWRVLRGDVTPETREFLRGHWLTAYAYDIAFDQFSRQGVPFEVYSNVQYTLPRDLGGGSSDIDVLVRTADLILCIECKSGRVLRTDGESAATKTRRNAERIDAVLDQMGVGLRREYQLLHLESRDETTDAVTAAVADSSVCLRIATPKDIRTLVRRIAARKQGSVQAA